MATTVTTAPLQRFDQAGLMVLLSPSCWLKTSVEAGGGGRPNQLGVVVTNAGARRAELMPACLRISAATALHGAGCCCRLL